MKPRLGFVGVGWIGRNRLEALLQDDAAEACVIVDPVRENRLAAAELAPKAVQYGSLEEALTHELDGVVLATPSALHAAQTITALEHGVAVFCQKPLARTAGETRVVVETARTADRLLGVDFSYRHTAAMQAIAAHAGSGELGSIYALDLTFHNAYGPDKPWFYDRAQSGGGCVMDLGVHLVDLALWLTGFPSVESVESHLYAGGTRLPAGAAHGPCEDYAAVQLALDGGISVRLTCSWNLPAGRDAVISATVWGTGGGLAMRNVNGSFFDFVAERYARTQTFVLSEPPDDWGGRAAIAWARELGRGARFSATAEEHIRVAEVVDAIYGAPGSISCVS